MDAEGVFDRRRANMLIIDFMTPTIVPSGLYGNLSNLQQEITLFKQTSDSAVKENYRQDIINQTRNLSLDNEIIHKVTPDEPIPEDALSCVIGIRKTGE